MFSPAGSGLHDDFSMSRFPCCWEVSSHACDIQHVLPSQLVQVVFM